MNCVVYSGLLNRCVFEPCQRIDCSAAETLTSDGVIRNTRTSWPPVSPRPTRIRIPCRRRTSPRHQARSRHLCPTGQVPRNRCAQGFLVQLTCRPPRDSSSVTEWCPSWLTPGCDRRSPIAGVPLVRRGAVPLDASGRGGPSGARLDNLASFRSLSRLCRQERRRSPGGRDDERGHGDSKDRGSRDVWSHRIRTEDVGMLRHLGLLWSG